MAIDNSKPWLSLTKDSGYNDVAGAYKSFLGSMGSVDTQATRDEAASFLTNLGMNAPQIDKAYDHFLANQSKPAAGPAATDPFAYNQKNPYLDEMSQVITGQVNDNLTRKVLPGIASSAMQAGGFGGSRQGVVEANALNDANRGLSDALTNMRFGDYNNTMNRQLQKYGMDQNYNLGMGGLQLGNRNADMNQVQLGANLFQQSNQGMMRQGQGIYDLGTTGQQAPWQTLQNFGDVARPFSGNASTTQNESGSAGAGFLGGALAGSQTYNIFSK